MKDFGLVKKGLLFEVGKLFKSYSQVENVVKQ